MSELSITVTIADRPYRLRINRSEEEVVRKANRDIEEQIKTYARNFEFKDKQDLLAMVALQYAVASSSLEGQISYHNNELHDRLVAIDEMLTERVT